MGDPQTSTPMHLGDDEGSETRPAFQEPLKRALLGFRDWLHNPATF